MKCENCGKNEVTFVYQSNINGKVEEKHLCHECAEKLGYTSKVRDSYGAMQNMFRRSMASMFTPMFAGSRGSSLFGNSFFGDDFFGGSLLGDSFFQDFFSAPAISAGETAESAGEKEHLVSEEESRQVQRQRELNALRLEMKRAVESENFERAAELRDQIHAKEKEN